MSNLWEDVGWVFSRAKFSFLIYTHNIYLNCWVDTRGPNQTKFVAENVIFYFRKSSLNLIGSIFSLVSAVKFNPIKHNLQNVSSVQPEVAHSLLLVFFFFDKWLHHFFQKLALKRKAICEWKYVVFSLSLENASLYKNFATTRGNPEV